MSSRIGTSAEGFLALSAFVSVLFRKKSKSHRDIKRMQCECPVLPREERSKGALACGEDCLNRLLMIEW